MVGRLGIALIAALTLLGAAPARADELTDRQTIIDQASGLLRNGRFAEFERTRAAYLASQSKTASGVWKLYYFDMGAMDAVTEGMDTTQCVFPRAGVLQRYSAALPNSVTAKIMSAKLTLATAQCWRGGSSFSKVQLSRLGPFYKYARQAETQMTALRPIVKGDPDWYSAMAAVGLYSGWSEAKVQGLLEEGLRANPGYFSLYFDYAVYYMQRWYGDRKTLERYVRWAASHARTKDESDALYARIYWSAMADFDEWPPTMDWKRMVRGMAAIEKASPDAWNRNSFARLACRADEPETAARYMPARRPDWRGEVYPWDNFGEYQACVTKVEVWRRSH